MCQKKGDISIIKNKEREGAGVCKESVVKEVYTTIEVTTDVTSILYAEER